MPFAAFSNTSKYNEIWGELPALEMVCMIKDI